MAVAYDASASGSTTAAGTSIPNFTLTIGSITNGAVVVALTFSAKAVSGFTVTIGGVTASAIASADSGSGGSATYRSLLYGLATGSTTGAQTVAVSWTTSSSAVVGALSFSGVDQTTPFSNGAGTQSPAQGAGGGTISQQVTSTSGDLTVVAATDETGGANSMTSATQTQRLNVRSTDFAVDTVASTGAGAGTDTHTWSVGAFHVNELAGANVKAASAGGRALFQTPPLSGVGIGGSFFRDPLQGAGA